MAISLIKGITEYNLKTIYEDKYIIEAIRYDGNTPSPIIHPLVQYYSAFINDVFVGAFIKILYSEYERELHSLLLKSAIRCSRDFITMMIDECFLDKKILRITFTIMEGMNTVSNTLIKIGARLEGTKKDAIKKDGQIKDIHIYGLTKKEWEEPWQY